MPPLNTPRPGDNLELDIQAHEAGLYLDSLTPADALREFARLCSLKRLGGVPATWIREAVRHLGPGCLTIIGRREALAEDGASWYPVLVARIDRKPYEAGQRHRTAYLVWAPAAEGRAEILLERAGLPPDPRQQCPDDRAEAGKDT